MRWTWKHGLALFVGLDLAAFGLPLVVGPIARALGRPPPREGQREFYRDLTLPSFAPPGWAFPLAWTTNRALATAAIVHVGNLPEDTPGRRSFLATQAAFWGLYTLFNPLYFTLRSPINGALTTAACTACMSASFGVAALQMRDARAAAALVPTLAWLALALPLSVRVAIDNPDTLWSR
jgi:translocator protein